MRRFESNTPCYAVVKEKESPISSKIIFAGFVASEEHVKPYMERTKCFIYQTKLWYCEHPAALLQSEREEILDFITAGWDKYARKSKKHETTKLKKATIFKLFPTNQWNGERMVNRK